MDRKSIIKQIGINIVIVLVAVFIFREVSYAEDPNSNKDNKDLLFETGNMQIVLNVPKERYDFNNLYSFGVSDDYGMKQDGYNFSITNIGSIPVEYYEIRLVDEENKVSTLPHKYLRFTIRKDNEKYSEVANLGEVNSVIYQGNNLGINETFNFNFKMWLEETFYFQNKKLYSALEVTLYQKNDILNNYVLYNTNNGESNLLKTSIYEPISSFIPVNEGYKFLGWSNTLNGDVTYVGGDTYKARQGVTLYAKWQKND